MTGGRFEKRPYRPVDGYNAKIHSVLPVKAEASSSMARQIGERFISLNAVMHPGASDSPHTGADF